MHPLLNTAVKAARRAGSVISRSFERFDAVNVQTKNLNDLVTEVDILAEQEIKNILLTAYPDHAILAEESGKEGESDHTWIIDPLDGTTNFVHGFPHFAVSIALQVNDKLEQAVVYDPIKDELFTASRGGGAYLDGKRIRVAARKKLLGSLIGTGFPFKNQDILDAYMEIFKSVFKESSGVRRAGSAALDLAYVAAGRLDGFWEIGLKPWDVAAGALMIQEAGGIITGFDGGSEFLNHGTVIGGNIKVHKDLLDKISPFAEKVLPKK